MPAFIRGWCSCVGLAVCVCLCKLLLTSTLLSLQLGWQNSVQVLANLFSTKPPQLAQNASISCCLAVLRQIRSVLFSRTFCGTRILQQGSSEVSNHSRRAKHFCPSASRQFTQCSGDKGLMEGWAPTWAQNALSLLWLLEQRGKGTTLHDGVESSLMGSHEGFADAGRFAHVQVQNGQGRHCNSGFLALCNWMEREY